MADLPDWLIALLQGQQPHAPGPIGPAGGPPSMSYLTGAPPFAPQGLLAQGPLEGPPAFSYVNPSSPALGGSPEPLDTSYGAPGSPYRMPSGTPPTWAGQLSPMTSLGGPPASADVPIPPRRPSDFMATTVDRPSVADEGDTPVTPTPQQPIPLAPQAGPTSNVFGTPNSGAPGATSALGGIGNVLGKAGDFIGGLYGGGGPGDALIALGLSNRTGGKSIEALNAIGNQRLNQAKIDAYNLQLSQLANSQSTTRRWLLSQTEKKIDPETGKVSNAPALTPEAVDMALARSAQGDNTALNSYFKQYGEPDKYSVVQTASGPKLVNKYDPTDIKDIPGIEPHPFPMGQDPNTGMFRYGIYKDGKIVPVDSQGGEAPSVTLPPVDRSNPPKPGTPEAQKVKDRGEMYLSTLPGGVDGPLSNQVRAIAEGKQQLPPSTSPLGMALSHHVNQYDPFFDKTDSDARFQTRQSFARGKVADTMSTGRAVIGHIGHMSDWAEDLAKENTSSPAFNDLKNKVKIAVGGGLPALNYSQWADLVGREATKYYSPGGGTEGERAAISERLNAAGSPAQLRSAIKTVADAIQSKTESLQEQWHQGMGPSSEDYPIMGKPELDTLAKISERASKVKGGVASSSENRSTADIPWSFGRR